jgi:hypothetical protein
VLPSCGWTQHATAMSPSDAIGSFNPVTLSREPWVIEREWLASLIGNRKRMS